MQPDLESLRITPSEVEHLTGLDISDTFMGRVYRPSLFRYRQRLFSFLLTELFTLGLLLIFCLPLGLVAARSLNSDAQTSGGFLAIATTIAVVLFAGWNGSMWMMTKRLTTLAQLLDEVDRHNEIVQAVAIMDELDGIRSPQMQGINREAVVRALTASRESVVCGLMTEKILRKHQRFMARRYELFSHIETNLATLRELQVNSEAENYRQVLNEALEIGQAVQREMDSFR